jgi:hypothetical protein
MLTFNASSNPHTKTLQNGGRNMDLSSSNTPGPAITTTVFEPFFRPWWRLFIVGVVIAGVWSIAPGAKAQNPPAYDMYVFETGNDLYAACNSADPFGRGRCMGYVEAINDAMAMPMRQQEIPTGDFGQFRRCIPGNPTAGQMKDVVVQYLQKNPANRHQSAARLAARALMEAYPCQ